MGNLVCRQFHKARSPKSVALKVPSCQLSVWSEEDVLTIPEQHTLPRYLPPFKAIYPIANGRCLVETDFGDMFIWDKLTPEEDQPFYSPGGEKIGLIWRLGKLLIMTKASYLYFWPDVKLSNAYARDEAEESKLSMVVDDNIDEYSSEHDPNADIIGVRHLGKHLLSWDWLGRFVLWDIDKQEPVKHRDFKPLGAHHYHETHLQVSVDNRFVLFRIGTPKDDKYVLWDLLTDAVLENTLAGNIKLVSDCADVVVYFDREQLYLADIHSSQGLFLNERFRLPISGIKDVLAMPNGDLLVLTNNSMQVLNISARKVTAVLEIEPVATVEAIRDDSSILFFNGQNSICHWQPQEHQAQVILRSDEDIYNLECLPDGRLLINTEFAYSIYAPTLHTLEQTTPTHNHVGKTGGWAIDLSSNIAAHFCPERIKRKLLATYHPDTDSIISVDYNSKLRSEPCTVKKERRLMLQL